MGKVITLLEAQATKEMLKVSDDSPTQRAAKVELRDVKLVREQQARKELYAMRKESERKEAAAKKAEDMLRDMESNEERAAEKPSGDARHGVRKAVDLLIRGGVNQRG